jgi:type IV secretion system protein VirB2
VGNEHLRVTSISVQSPSALVASVSWIETLVTGSLAASVAVIAIAALGFIMLSGRIDWHRSARAIVGCFLIFGAPLLASGLIDLLSFSATGVREPVEQPTIAPPPPRPPEAYDPYAGAALPSRW